MVMLRQTTSNPQHFVGDSEYKSDQNAYWMYELLSDSLPDGARIFIAVESDSFKVNGKENEPCCFQPEISLERLSICKRDERADLKR